MVVTCVGMWGCGDAGVRLSSRASAVSRGIRRTVGSRIPRWVSRGDTEGTESPGNSLGQLIEACGSRGGAEARRTALRVEHRAPTHRSSLPTPSKSSTVRRGDHSTGTERSVVIRVIHSLAVGMPSERVRGRVRWCISDWAHADECVGKSDPNDTASGVGTSPGRTALTHSRTHAPTHPRTHAPTHPRTASAEPVYGFR